MPVILLSLALWLHSRASIVHPQQQLSLQIVRWRFNLTSFLFTFIVFLGTTIGDGWEPTEGQN